MATATLEHSDTLLNVHDPERCDGRYCSVHKRSDHSMRSFPQIWRWDRGIMERICPHGIGHPDPDEMSYLASLLPEEIVYANGVHGCDGCCA